MLIDLIQKKNLGYGMGHKRYIVCVNDFNDDHLMAWYFSLCNGVCFYRTINAILENVFLENKIKGTCHFCYNPSQFEKIKYE